MNTKLFRALFVLSLSSVMLFSCAKEEDDDNNGGTNNNPPADAPTAVLGQSYNMIFSTANMGAPYSLNQEVKITFATNGNFQLDENPTDNDGNEIDIAFGVKSGNEYVWNDDDFTYSYVLSLIGDSVINEVNLFELGAGQFLGQFTLVEEGSDNLVANYEGMYDVTSVLKGSHDRMTLSIDSDGNIDFDTDDQFSSDDYELVTDRLSVLDQIFLDMSPYPSEPYPRVELTVDNGSGDLSSLQYYPEYPNVSGRVEVEVSKK